MTTKNRNEKTMSKLHAKDLMIGDWVLNTHNNPEKVQQIIANFNDELAIMLDGNCIYGSDEIAPIPLTAEILEKNFPDTEILVWYGNEDKWHIECPAFEDLQVEIEIKYVHQLQHILRLCGFEKEIQL